MSSLLKYLVIAFISFILGFSVSRNSHNPLTNRELFYSAKAKNHNINQTRTDTIAFKLKILVSSLSNQKSQEEIISELPFHALKQKINELDKIHREIVKERLDPNDFFSKDNPSQFVVNDFTKEFVNSKKEWLKKIIYLDETKMNIIVIFSKVETCKRNSPLIQVKTFENTHCYEQSMFFKVEKQWIQHGRTGGISWYNYYKNKPFFEIQLSDIKMLERFRIVKIYAGLEDNNDEVFGLILENNKYFWKDFSSTNWEEIKDVEKKQFVSDVEKSK